MLGKARYRIRRRPPPCRLARPPRPSSTLLFPRSLTCRVPRRPHCLKVQSSATTGQTKTRGRNPCATRIATSSFRKRPPSRPNLRPGSTGSCISMRMGQRASLAPTRCISTLYRHRRCESYRRSEPVAPELTVIIRLVYACGSLYTSIIPCLALRGVGEAIATSPSLRHKILLLNSSLDRETPGYSALDFVEAIREAATASYGQHCGSAGIAKDFV